MAPPDATLGRQLVADYQSVFINMATSKAARQAAEQSEQAVLQQLGQVSGGNFLQPGNLSADWQAGLTRESIDAHIKKVQAAQMDELSSNQLAEMIAADTKTYTGKKVRVTTLSRQQKPFEAVWFDKRTGYRNSPYTTGIITGHIQEVLLDRNALVLKPLWAKHLFVPSLQLLVAYIINPADLQPMVDITVL